MGFSKPTQIQEKCIPEIKAGKDVVGQSLTGSGKTAAFGLPILEKILPGEGIQALILTPTRELSVQVRDHLDQMSKFLPINIRNIYGGVGYYEQKESIKIAEIIVATPGRLLDHIGRRNIDLSTIKFVVLDEADKMFEMGFEQDVDKILSYTPKERQTIMFSATMPPAARNIISRYLKKPVYFQEKLQVDRSLLKQVFYPVRKDQKFSLLVHLLKEKTAGPAIVFCGTKRTVDAIAKTLKHNKIDALPVHGDLTQGKRNHSVNSFKDGKIDVLVATDVAARGLDIKDVTHVYNYDVPKTPEDYTHRIGRTARAGKKGDAVTFVSDRDVRSFNAILRQGKMQILEERIPSFEEIPFGRQDSFEHRGFSRNSNEFRSNREHNSFGRQRSFGNRSSSPRTYNNTESEHKNYSHPRENRGPSQRREGSRPQRSNFSQNRSHYESNRSAEPVQHTPQDQTSKPQENYEQEYDALRTQRSFGQRNERYGSRDRGSFRSNRNSFGNKPRFNNSERSFGPRREYGNTRNNFRSKPNFGNNSRFNDSETSYEPKASFGSTGSFGHKKEYNNSRNNFENKQDSFKQNKSFGSKKKFSSRKSFGNKSKFFSGKKDRQ